MSQAEENTRGFLKRVRRATLLLGVLGVLVLSTYLGLARGGAWLVGVLLSLLNLGLLERIFGYAVSPEVRSVKRLALALLLKLPLLLGGVWLALGPLHLSPLWFLAGFTLVLLVIVLKALGWLLLSSRARGAEWTKRGLWLLGGAFMVTVPVLLRAAEHAGEAAKEEHMPELPNAISILHELFPTQSWAAFLYKWENPIYSTLVIVFLCVIAIITYRRRSMIPGKLQNAVELLVESFSNFILGILGPKGKEFIPFLGTLFFYIWLNNLQGLIPFLKSPTSVYNTTLSLAICVFGYVQYTGITKLGIVGYLHHLIGAPRDVIGWCMVPLMLPLHLIEEVAKPVSLSLRLFGNILGEDVLLGVFASLVVFILPLVKVQVGIPLHLPFIFLSVLMSTIQALVFTLLATIYFSQMMPHEEEHGEGGHA